MSNLCQSGGPLKNQQPSYSMQTHYEQEEGVSGLA